MPDFPRPGGQRLRIACHNFGVGILAIVLPMASATARVRNFDDHSWTDGPITIQVDTSGVEMRQSGAGIGLLAAINRAAGEWNAALGFDLLQIASIPAPVPDSARALGDQINGIYFSRVISPAQQFGSQFGFAASRRAPNGRFAETDLIFNPVHDWLVYNGPLRFTAEGDRVAEMHRVALHEFGHLLGLSHPGNDNFPTIMRSRMSDIDGLTVRDLADARLVADVLIDRNRPRVTRSQARSRNLWLTGTANAFFTRRLWVEIRSSGGREITRIRVGRRWHRRIRLPNGARRLTVFYTVSGQLRHRLAYRHSL